MTLRLQQCVDWLSEQTTLKYFEPQVEQYIECLWFVCEAGEGARSVLEIGVGPEAVSGMVFAHSMASRAGRWRPRLVSVEKNEEYPRKVYRDRALELNVGWDVVYGDSLHVEHDMVAPGMRYDMLYIDGAHDTEHAYGDYRRFAPLVVSGGYIVFDDYHGGVAAAVAEIEREDDVRFVIFPSVDGNARAVLRRK